MYFGQTFKAETWAAFDSSDQCSSDSGVLASPGSTARTERSIWSKIASAVSPIKIKGSLPYTRNDAHLVLIPDYCGAPEIKFKSKTRRVDRVFWEAHGSQYQKLFFLLILLPFLLVVVLTT